MGKQFMFIITYDEDSNTWFHDVGSEEYRYPEGCVWNEDTGGYEYDDTENYMMVDNVCRTLTMTYEAQNLGVMA